MKSFTDIEQSKWLSKILPLESADMCFLNDGTAIKVDTASYKGAKAMWGKYYVEITPCWSLVALLEVIPKRIKDYAVLRMDMGEKDFSIWYDDINLGMVNVYLPNVTKENPINACYEMIVKLNEQKLL